MNMKRCSLATGTAMVLILLTFGIVSAVPPLPSGFYGTVHVSGNSVPDSTVITASINGTQYATTHTFMYSGDSVYVLEVLGDDPETATIIEGGVEGDTIQFRINGLPAQSAEWHTGSNGELNLSLSPTAVTLAGFESFVMPDGAVQLHWETVSELSNQGFNLWRNTLPDGPVDQINEALIPSQAPGSAQGFAYTWEDSDVVSGQTYYYWLEDIDLNGTTTLHGPVSVTAGTPTAVTVSQLSAGNQPTNAWPGWVDTLVKALREFLAPVFSR